VYFKILKMIGKTYIKMQSVTLDRVFQTPDKRREEHGTVQRKDVIILSTLILSLSIIVTVVKCLE